MKTLIYKARAMRGWTQGRLVDELCQAAVRLGLKVASSPSLRVEISGWENGRHQPDVTYQLLLQEVFNLPPGALGFDNVEDQYVTETALHALVDKNASHCRITPEILTYFIEQLGQHARMDNVSGPAFVIATSCLQLKQLEKLASGDGDGEVLRMASRFAEFNGWLLQDSGQNGHALRVTERAIDLAEALGDSELTTYNLMRKSNILTAMHDMTSNPVVIARKAVDLAKRDAPDLLPVCLRQQALTDSGLGDEKATKIALDNALNIAASSKVNENNSLASYCTTSYIQMEAALCLLALRRPAEAVKACEDALGDWPPELVRDESLCLARLAVSYCELRQVDEACDAGHRAINLVYVAPSARTIHMLHIAAHKLQPFARNRRVREFAEALTQVA
ncbi:MAG: hypothetical protein ACRDX9_09325 [Acidimicrobiia bacterium]